VYTVTFAANGTTLTVHLGDRVVVDLPSCGAATWTGLQSDDEAVLARVPAVLSVEPSPLPVDPKPATATSLVFAAVGRGTADIAGRPTTPSCASAPASFSVTVVVE
jgi:hypothetical protein